MQKRDDLIGYDWQCWPIFKQNLKEILENLGGRIENNKIVFDLDDPILNLYPTVYEDDGMGYGVNGRCITEIDCNKEGENYIGIFAEKKPSKEMQEQLFKRWDEDEEFSKQLREKYKK